MERYSVQEAQEHLPKLIAEAQHGKAIFITGENDQVVQLVPLTGPSKPRKAGSARGLITISPNFDAPLSDFDGYVTSLPAKAGSFSGYARRNRPR